MSRHKKYERKIKIIIEIKEFLQHHKRRVKILKKILKESNDGRLVFQVSILGLESLAKIRYPNPKEGSGSRFIKLLSKEMKKKEAIEFYHLYRCSLIHEGFLSPFDMSECWEDKDIAFGCFYEKDIDLGTELYSNINYPPETLIIIYEDLVYYLEGYFKRKKIKSRILKPKESNKPSKSPSSSKSELHAHKQSE